MKKEYTNVIIEVILFDKDDIIATSGEYKFGSIFDVEKIIEWDTLDKEE